MIKIFNTNCIGSYIFSTPKYALIPEGLTDSQKSTIEETLDVPLITASVGGTRLLGAVCAGNSNGLLVPNFIFEKESEDLAKKIKAHLGSDFPVFKLQTKEYNALGNAILANDKGAAISAGLIQKSDQKASPNWPSSGPSKIPISSSYSGQTGWMDDAVAEEGVSFVFGKIPVESAEETIARSTSSGEPEEQGLEKPHSPYNLEKMDRTGHIRGSVPLSEYSTIRKQDILKNISDVLSIENISISTIAGFDLLGACGVANNDALLVHPMATQRELDQIAESLKVDDADIGTICNGNGRLGTGAVISKSGCVLVGDGTTGPELVRIAQVFRVD